MQTKVIKQKMKSIQNIGKITKAMEMISVSKMKKSVQKKNDSHIFAKRSLELLENLHIHKNLSHPYLEKRKGQRILMVIIASNKGLCGGYNTNISKRVLEFKNLNKKKNIDVIVVGKQAERIARRHHLTIIANFTEFSDYFNAGEVRSLLHSLTEHYNTALDYEEVVVAYTQFVSSLVFKADVTSLIPLDISSAQERAGIISKNKEESQKIFARYNFEPNEQEVLNKIVPSVLMTVLYQFLLESLASEHSARVIAMRNAGDNAQEMFNDLKLNYNRARQAAITQEIAEIVGGSSALAS